MALEATDRENVVVGMLVNANFNPTALPTTNTAHLHVIGFADNHNSLVDPFSSSDFQVTLAARPST
jgi:hypothetical protein